MWNYSIQNYLACPTDPGVPSHKSYNTTIFSKYAEKYILSVDMIWIDPVFLFGFNFHPTTSDRLGPVVARAALSA